MSSFEFALFTIMLVSVFITAVFFVIFGQLTVRKLRKNPAVKGKLGVEFVSGYDILNVASALSAPKWFREKASRSVLSFLSANYQVLYDNTTLFDRILARVFWGLFVLSGSSGILLVILDAAGLFD